MVAKKYQNPSGGLNEAGRKYFKRTTGANLKRPSKKVTGKRKKLDANKDGKLTKEDFAMLRKGKKKKA